MKYLEKIKVNKLRKLVYEKNVEEKEKSGYLLKEAPLTTSTNYCRTEK